MVALARGLGRKQTLADQHRWEAAYAAAPTLVPTDALERLLARTVAHIHTTCARGRMAFGWSGGKDSVHGDSILYARIDGIPMRTTARELFRLVASDVMELESDGRAYLVPRQCVEILAADTRRQQTARISFHRIAGMMAHQTTAPLYRVTTSGGRTLIVTGDHSVMMRRAEAHAASYSAGEVRTLKVGDMLAAVTHFAFEGVAVPLADHLLRLGGLWLADGCYAVNRKVIISTGNQPALLDFLKQIPRPPSPSEVALAASVTIAPTSSVLGTARAIATATGVSVETARLALRHGVKRTHPCIRVRVTPKGDAWLCSKALVTVLQQHGFQGTGTAKAFPSWAFTATVEQIALLLAGYFDGDGCFHARGISVSSISTGLAEGTQELLWRLGIESTLSISEKIGGFRTQMGRLYTVEIVRQTAVARFYERIPVLRPHPAPPARRTTPAQCHDLISRTIRSIEQLPAEPQVVYDFEVPDNHTFVAGSLLVHNSLVLEHVMRLAGVTECVLVVTHLEYRAFLQWVTDHMPPELTVLRTPHDLAWLVAHPDMLFPRTSAIAGRWFHQVQHWGQQRYVQTHDVAVLAVGRRRLDGNYCGPDGLYTNRAGVTRYAPLMDWTHEEVFAALHYFGCTLPPCYQWPRGYQVGTGPWPARQFARSLRQAWDEVWQIDQDVVLEAARVLPSAGAYLAILDSETLCAASSPSVVPPLIPPLSPTS